MYKKEEQILNELSKEIEIIKNKELLLKKELTNEKLKTLSIESKNAIILELQILEDRTKEIIKKISEIEDLTKPEI